ncbi:MAG: rod shape-determining protein RodA [Flavobacteriaceae bacterium]|nr:rod shape-determining protein RodA [Flavobacteriaceae bacterium]|tara:strand:+ start:3835 stop:5094 length:1260 start_codon:yes stop_codon:yes gene_type:complete
MNKTFRIDWITIIIYFLLVATGISNIFSSTYDIDSFSYISADNLAFKQFVFFIFSLISGILILIAPSKFFLRFSSLIYLFSILLLLGLFAFGNTVYGHKSWYTFFGVSIQPTEIAKFATNLAVAKLLSEIEIDLKKTSSLIQIFLIISIPVILTLIQPDFGSALIFLSFIFVLFREGLNPNFLLFLALFLILAFFALIKPFFYVSVFLTGFFSCFYFLSKKINKKVSITPLIIVFILSCVYVYSINYVYNDLLSQRHKDRIDVFLGKETDVMGIGYNLNQSIIAIGSGGLSGKGFLQGTQTKGKFVPRQHTDYIFSTIGEEWGFYGTSIIIILFTSLILRILFRAEQQKNIFGRSYAYGTASLIFMHFFINIGMSIGLVPTIGIPLPFISYGGSSMYTFTTLVFVYLNIDANRLNETSI